MSPATGRCSAGASPRSPTGSLHGLLTVIGAYEPGMAVTIRVRTITRCQSRPRARLPGKGFPPREECPFPARPAHNDPARPGLPRRAAGHRGACPGRGRHRGREGDGGHGPCGPGQQPVQALSAFRRGDRTGRAFRGQERQLWRAAGMPRGPRRTAQFHRDPIRAAHLACQTAGLSIHLARLQLGHLLVPGQRPAETGVRTAPAGGHLVHHPGAERRVGRGIRHLVRHAADEHRAGGRRGDD